AYKALFRGEGLEFEEVREYAPTDDARRIDWNVTARMGKPFVKRYREERELTVLLTVDISNSSLYGTFSSAREIMATLSAAIAFSAIRNNDKVGLILFSDRIDAYIPPRRGRNHLLTVIRTLLTVDPSPETDFRKSGKKKVLYQEESDLQTNPEEAFNFLLKVMKKKSLIFFLSDMFFGKIPESLKTARRKHEIIPVGIYDKTSFAPLKHAYVKTVDPESGKEHILDFSGNRKNRWESICRKKDREFKKLRMPPVWIENREDFINDLILGFRKLEKQRL
ncbi:MAG: DUF58 domain-containing protein, partial [bacterium]